MMKTLVLVLAIVTSFASGYFLAPGKQPLAKGLVYQEEAVALPDTGQIIEQKLAQSIPADHQSSGPIADEQLRAVIREELTWALSDFAEYWPAVSGANRVDPAQPEQEMFDPDGEQFAQASSFLETRIEASTWTMEDAQHLRELASGLGENALKALLDTLFTAVNNGSIELDPTVPLF